MAEIAIKNVAKSFGAFTALHSVDLTIADQEFMVLLGASGCGKTTLLRIIAGLETPSQGEVWIGGRRVDHLPPRRRGIAMVFQNYAVFPHLTVFENIAFGLRMARLPSAEIDRRVNRTAELMHIEQLLKRYSGQLSGGQRQRVAVARALAMEPDVILMDEPLSNLDALLRLEMRAELKGVLATSRTTTIYVTHDQVEAMSLADRIAVMHQGRIIQAASPVEVYRNPAARFVGSFIGNPPMNFLPAKSLGRRQLVGCGSDDAGPADRRERSSSPSGRRTWMWPRRASLIDRARGRAARGAHAGDGRRGGPPVPGGARFHHRRQGRRSVEPQAARRPHPVVRSRDDGGDHVAGGQSWEGRMAGLNKQDYVDRADRRAEGERSRHLHRADQGALSISMELGFLLDGARPAVLRRGSRLDRDRDAVRAPVAGRHGAPHRLPRA